MLSPSKTVLVISDEALYIYSSGFKGMELVEVVPWEAENFITNVSKIISKDCSKRPLVILNDMVEQHYRKEKVPKVNVMDKKNVVKRKLNVSFPSYPVKAALPLKETIPKTETTPASNIYIFAAAPESAPYHKTMEAARRSLSSIKGYGLLPVESSIMVKTLAAKLSGRTKKKAKWAVFIGQHQNGGLRQIVTKNGELALTRMTPVVDSDADPDQWAAEVYQEFQATLSYMSRFGFTVDEGLDIMVVANPQAGDILNGILDIEANIYTMTAAEIAKKLGLSISSFVDQRYADILHVAWIAKKSKMILPMEAKELNAISKPRNVAALASVLLLGGAGYLGYQAFNLYEDLASTQEAIGDIRARHAGLQRQYEEEVAKKEALGFDVRLVQNSMKVYDKLEAQDIDALYVFHGIGRSIGRDLRLDEVSMEKIEDSLLNRASNFVNTYVNSDQAQKNHVYSARVQFTFPSTTDIDRGNEEINALRDRLRKALPNHTVEVDKYLKDTEFVDELVIDENRNNDPEDVAQDYIVSISIKGANS
ncbi:MAG: hypothetical protein ACLFR0_01170 [Alphaproteobacteria bacterium]